MKYEPGELRAVAYRGGRKWAEGTMKTTGPAAKIAMKADRVSIRADGSDLAFVTVGVTDREGLQVPRSANLVRFDISGPGDIVAVDNGDPNSHESFQAHEVRAFNGLCLVIVRARKGQGGVVSLKAVSDQLQESTVTIRCSKSF